MRSWNTCDEAGCTTMIYGNNTKCAVHRFTEIGGMEELRVGIREVADLLSTMDLSGPEYKIREVLKRAAKKLEKHYRSVWGDK